MGLAPQASFSAGELDPALRERTTLQKYKTGLATARNVYIAKTGRIVTRASRKQFVKTKLSGRKVKIHTNSDTGAIIEWGHQYARVYTYNPDDITDYNMDEFVHAIPESDLDLVKFVDGKDVGTVYVFCYGRTVGLFSLLGPPTGNVVSLGAAPFGIPTAPTYVSNTVSGTGYDVDYAVTMVINGEESAFATTATGKMIINNTEKNTIVFRVVGGAAFASQITEMKVYRRPRSGGAFGYVGSSSSFATTGSDRDGTFVDIGGAADYTHSPPTINLTMQLRGLSGPAALLSRTGLVYQQRLLISSYTGIEASRTGSPTNFYRDYPLNADSSLSFKAGSSGYAEILDLIESDGLVAFTSKGVYLNIGALSPTNIALDRKGTWIIDVRIRPLLVPGGLLFVDATTNCIRRLAWSTENAGYLGQELSIFSNHLFEGKLITSWAFEDGVAPVVWVTLSDGTFLSFTYEQDQEMRAWTRHDSSNVNVEYVSAMPKGSKSQFYLFKELQPHSIFVVEKDGERYIEFGITRFVSDAIKVSDPESDKNESNAFMDSMVSWKSLVNDDLVGNDVFSLTPVTPDDWEGLLTLTCGTSALFTNPGRGAIGTRFRHFDLVLGDMVDLVVTARANDNSVTVQPSSEYPSDQASGFRLYDTKKIFDGLDHMEGESVSVMVDGYVAASPNNDQDPYDAIVVTGGEIELPAEFNGGAIVHIGRPITADAETLDIETVEQRPVFLESDTLNKLYLQQYRSRGMWIGPQFPADNKVKGEATEIPMVDVDKIDVDYDEDIEVVGNRYQAPTTERKEVTLPGDWDSRGRVCVRQVDPVHFEILSIIPDLEDLRR